MAAEIVSDPIEALSMRITERQEELDILVPSFEEAYRLVTDHEAVNAAIASSPRPDLVITDPAVMMVVPNVSGLARTNNFQPGMRSFGSRVYEDLDEPDYRGETRKWKGYTPPTDQELELYFLVGARGGYHDYKRFIEERSLDEKHVMDMFLQSHIGKPAFMRMWIACPDLTVALMRKCADGHEPYKQDGEELFVAYSLMSQLVDKRDTSVLRPELTGQVDEFNVDSWYLCR